MGDESGDELWQQFPCHAFETDRGEAVQFRRIFVDDDEGCSPRRDVERNVGGGIDGQAGTHRDDGISLRSPMVGKGDLVLGQHLAVEHDCRLENAAAVITVRVNVAIDPAGFDFGGLVWCAALHAGDSIGVAV